MLGWAGLGWRWPILAYPLHGWPGLGGTGLGWSWGSDGGEWAVGAVFYRFRTFFKRFHQRLPPGGLFPGILPVVGGRHGVGG